MNTNMSTVSGSIIFLIGLIFGSFLNVCIYRIPLKISIVKPGSFCPHCKQPVPLWSNIPLLGFIILKGHCQYCKGKISWQYPVVELIAGFGTLLSFQHFGFSPVLLVNTGIIYFLIVVAFIDFQKMIIPNSVTILMFIFVLAVQIIYPFHSWLVAIYGLFTGGLTLYFIGILGRLLFKKESMGWGDIKLASVLGFFFGWPDILLLIYMSFMLGLIGYLVLRLIKYKSAYEYVPLGTYLSLAGFVFIFWGEMLKNIYLNTIL